MTNDDKSIDVLGIKPIGDSIKMVTQAVAEGAASFLGRICLPAAEEFGLLLQDKVHAWRTANLAAMARKAEELVGDADISAPPRLVSHIVEEASWVDDRYLRDMWAGLLASSCSDTGDDDSNLLFLNILADLTTLQVRLLKYICENAPKYVTPLGLPFAREMTLDIKTLTTVCECDDVQRIDREIDNLRGLELLEGGFSVDGSGFSTPDAIVTPSAIALHMYVRCQGSRQSPVEYFSLELHPRGASSQSESEFKDAT